MNGDVFLITMCLFSLFKNCKEIDDGNNFYNMLIESTVCIVCFIRVLKELMT